MKTIVIAALMAGVLVTTAGCISASRASAEASRGAAPTRRVALYPTSPAAFTLPTPQHLAAAQPAAVSFPREPWQPFRAPGFAPDASEATPPAKRTPRATTEDDARYSLARLNEMARGGTVPPAEYQRTQSMLKAFQDPMQEAREALQWRDAR